MTDEIQLQFQFEEDYAQMLRDMFDWPFEDNYPEPPEGYTPIEIPPEPETFVPVQRSHLLQIATWKSSEGRKLITDMDDFHLNNTINFLRRTDYPNNRDTLKLMLEEQDCRRIEENQK